jgi:hypothetical protein
VLPWLNAQDKLRLQESRIRQSVSEQLGGSADDPRVQAAVTAALAQLKTKSADTESDSTTSSALRHEIGHKLLIDSFWPTAQVKGGGHYGGPAADWLDETAAVLMEDAAMTTQRIKQLRTLRDEKTVRTLSEFFSGEHPMRKMAANLSALQRPAADAKQTGARITMVSGDDAKKLVTDAAWFYAQSRGVADFLLAESGDAALFGKIAMAAAKQQSFEQWLASEGKDHNLPVTLDALELRWQAWLTKL